MENKIKTVSKTSFPDVFGESQHYQVISVRETVKVFTEEITNDHVYWVKDNEDINNPDNYMEPLDDPDRNIKLDYNVYRERYNLYSGTEAKAVRDKYGLTQRELSCLLGISYSTLADIENERILQSIQQDNILKLISEESNLVALYNDHEELINERLRKFNINPEKVVSKIKGDITRHSSITFGFPSFHNILEKEGSATTWGQPKTVQLRTT